jgi:hypothetical protein
MVTRAAVGWLVGLGAGLPVPAPLVGVGLAFGEPLGLEDAPGLAGPVGLGVAATPVEPGTGCVSGDVP